MNDINTGLQFEFTYAPGITKEQILAFEMAGETWSSYLKDNLTVPIHVEITDTLPENIIGGALPGMQSNLNYDKLWQQMSEDIISEDDLVAFTNLSSTGNFYQAIANGDELDKGKKTKLTNANAKALNLISGDLQELDGYILINDLKQRSDVTWNYTGFSNDNISNRELDFFSVALHEIGHVLGFVSGIDDSDWLTTVTKAEDTNKSIRDTAIRFATPLDLFRYSDLSVQTGQIDFSIGGESFFSLDGGQTNLGGFSTGQSIDLGGDGFQASHWKNQKNPLGIMQPVLEAGMRREISSLDLTAMDVMGWDLAETTELNWQQIFDTASDNAEISVVEDRSAEVQNLIHSNEEYHGRIGRYSSSYDFAWQTGLWQFSTIEELDSTIEDDLVDSTSTTPIIEEVTDSTLLFSDRTHGNGKSKDKSKDKKNGNHSEPEAPLFSSSNDNNEEIIADNGVSTDSLLSDDWISEEVELISDLDLSLVIPIN